MNHASLAAFLERDRAALARGPVAIIVVEDPVEVESTLNHHIGLGFRTLIAFMPDGLELPATLADQVHRIPCASRGPEALPGLINPLLAAAPEGTWFYYGFNAEYLFYPFSETRNVRELLAFHTEERRDAMLCYAIDLYAPDLGTHSNGVDREGAMLDRSGYYALARQDPANHYHPKDRQLDFFGGLRWRFDEHIPQNRRKIDRIALFRSRKGLELRPNHTFNDEEYNTFACPWHHNLTAAVMSFRVAKALKYNPGSSFEVQNFSWHNSVRFDWSSQQLMDLGLIEPGQWF